MLGDQIKQGVEHDSVNKERNRGVLFSFLDRETRRKLGISHPASTTPLVSPILVGENKNGTTQFFSDYLMKMNEKVQ